MRVALCVLFVCLVAGAAAVAARGLSDELDIELATAEDAIDIDADEFSGAEQPMEPLPPRAAPTPDHESMSSRIGGVHPAPPYWRRPPARMPIIRRAPLSTRNLTDLFMRALQHRNVLLALALLDHNTVIAYPTDLPFGGTYKGHRGLLALGEHVHKAMRITNSSFNIISVDEARGTAVVKVAKCGVVRRTGRAVHTDTLMTLTFSLNKLKCVDIIDLNAHEVKTAFETRAEAALCRLGETWFAEGDLSPRTLALFADNFTLHFHATEPRDLITVRSKDELVNKLRNKAHYQEAGCKFLHCLLNHTQLSLVVHADDHVVVTAHAVADDVLVSRKRFEQFPEGTVVPGISRIGTGMTVLYTCAEVDNDGKLTKVTIQLDRPLTLMDRVYLRNTYNINITVPIADHI